MRFEEALKAMREGKKVVYREEIYFIGDEGDLRDTKLMMMEY